MKIYLAGPWARREEVKEVAKRLETAGHEITSRWLYAHAGPPNDPAGLTHSDEHIRNEALDDVSDVLRAEAFVILNLEKSEGKAVELGIAYMAGKCIYSVGQRFNIFCTLGTQVRDIDELFSTLPTAIPA